MGTVKKVCHPEEERDKNHVFSGHYITKQAQNLCIAAHFEHVQNVKDVENVMSNVMSDVMS